MKLQWHTFEVNKKNRILSKRLQVTQTSNIHPAGFSDVTCIHGGFLCVFGATPMVEFVRLRLKLFNFLNEGASINVLTHSNLEPFTLL
jgi:hypothetical protein